MYSVYTYKVDAMKQLQQAVARSGYSHYSAGTIELKKLDTLLYKFEDRYRINATKQMRYRAKQRGEANTTIILLKDGQLIRFWLLVTDGFGAVTDMEKLYSTTDKKNRLTYTGYELVRVQKSDKVTWTWRMTKENYTEFEQRIKDACRHKNKDHIEQCFYSLQRMPVFSAMRQQAFSLFKLLNHEYTRSHKETYPNELLKNFYGRYKEATKIDAIELCKKARRISFKSTADELIELNQKRDTLYLARELDYVEIEYVTNKINLLLK